MILTRLGSIAALTCAATYLVGFATLVTLLAPLGYGKYEVDAAAVLAFNAAHPGILTAWNSAIYLLNALSLVVLVTALSTRLPWTAPDWARVARGLGLVWATLVLGAGMISNVALERASYLYDTDPAGAAELWTILHTVELGLGGGNEIAGGAWIGCVSLAGLIGGNLSRPVAWLGLATGTAGLATIISPLGHVTGAVFGLGAIVWFLAVGVGLWSTATKSSISRGVRVDPNARLPNDPKCSTLLCPIAGRVA
ncbi:hypothetical protein [Kangsaoukella pontilimi]|uniref:hypothetical protein n=1 Tax=Kangsaoukella pontilimi TaxID=2691042 RepID=UPI001D0BD554|nr:hypothetical protein [Kangsaoukella pontilimi]